MAIGLYNQITETSSLMIGEQIHLIGFDNIELTRYMQPRLATIDYSKRKWGPRSRTTDQADRRGNR